MKKLVNTVEVTFLTEFSSKIPASKVYGSHMGTHMAPYGPHIESAGELYMGPIWAGPNWTYMGPIWVQSELPVSILTLISDFV